MRTTTIALALSIALLSSTPALYAESTDTPEAAFDRLQLVEKDRRSALYALPDVDWSAYRAILLEDATVAFRKDWLRDQNRNRATRVSSRDVERIKSDLAELFDQVFAEELGENGGFEIVSEPGDDVLRIAAHIVDLDIYAPQTTWSGGVNRSYTDSAGQMTLKLELYDSVTGDLLAASSERREAPHRGYMQWTTSVSNKSDARQMLRSWAVDLRKRLQKASQQQAD